MKLPESYLTCMVDGCDWRMPMAEVELKTMATSYLVNQETLELVAKRAMTVEDIIRRHAESHDVLDYLRTIQRLRMDLAQQGSGIRPHVYESCHQEGDT